MATIDSSKIQEAGDRLQRPRHVEVVVGTLQKIYILGLMLLCLAIVFVLVVKGPSRYQVGQWVCIGLGFEAVAFTYLGLRTRKPWVVSLIVFDSAYTMIPCVADQPETLARVIIARALAVLTLYQLWFFTRPDTRRFFGTNGTTVF